MSGSEGRAGTVSMISADGRGSVLAAAEVFCKGFAVGMVGFSCEGAHNRKDDHIDNGDTSRGRQ